MLEELQIVLANTRFPENIGMVARACANMGCSTIRLVAPELWSINKAIPLATAQGKPLLEKIQICKNLSDAVKDSHLVMGTTARTGGWRKNFLDPEQAAEQISVEISEGNRVSLVFGPEDRGLTNEEISACHEVINIPTALRASSINLAQSVLIILYECHKAAKRIKKSAVDRNKPSLRGSFITAGEFSRMMDTLKDMLLDIDYLHGNNPDYFMLIWQKLLYRSRLKRYEYDAVMGMCRQVKNKVFHHVRH